jgi:phenol 2-monooxygenase (NADPH)
MPVFTEFSTSSRELRVLPSFAPPVPRHTPRFTGSGKEEKYEVVIVGVRGIYICMYISHP